MSDETTPADVLVLVVEDDPGIQELVQAIVVELGARAAQAATGSQALSLLREARPQFVILDYSLPDMTGLELVERAGAMPPFMITTGAGDERIAVQLMKRGARDYLVKDAQFLEALPKTISRILRELDTERKLEEAEQALAQRSERLHLVLEGTNDAFWDWNLETGALYYSDRWFEMFGYSRGEVEPTIGLWEQHLHPEDRQRVLSAIRDHIAGRTTGIYRSEHRLRNRAGEYQWVEGRGRIVAWDAQGKPLRLAGMITDITARKQAEADLRKLTTAVEQSPASIVITDIKGNIEYINPAFCRHTGYTAEDVLGKNPRILKSGEHGEDLYRELWTTITSGGTWRGEFHNKKKNGELFWEMALISPILNGEGRTTNYLAVKEDITERKRSEEALRRAQKLESLAVMAGGIAHDFNNLFTAVLGNVDIAELSLPEEAPVRSQLEIIRSAVTRATHLSKQMLAFSGMGKFLPEHLALGQMVAEAEEGLREKLPSSATLAVECADDALGIEGDPHQIQQVIEALVINAGEALDGKGGAILIRARREALASLPDGAQFPGLPFVPGEYSILEVRDTGCGMSSDVLSRIFDPFFTTKFTGRGLSLAASMGILRAHNAGIRVESRLGGGSTFTIYFPAIVAPSRPAPIAPPPTASQVPGPKRILLVDDEAVLRNSTAELLGTLGYDVIEAVDGLDALEKYRAEPGEIGLVIMDLTMPRMNGREAFLAMKRFDPGARIVLSSGYSEHEVTGSIQDQGLAGFLQKPYRFSDLKAMVSRLLGEN